MNFKAIAKNVSPYVLIIFLFIVAGYLYFSPVLEGKQLLQMDNINARGQAKEIKDHKEETGESTQWTNSMFGGMPAYHIGGSETRNIFRITDSWLRLGLPYKSVAMLFIYMVGFFILLQSIKLNKWLSFIGALVFAFASYKIIIIGAGHITKAYAIGYMPVVIAGVILAYRKKYLTGGLLALLGTGYELAPNHVQITYYLAMFLIVLAIGYFIYFLRKDMLAHFFKASGILIIAAVLAVAPSVDTLWKTYEYSEHSIRGKKELDSQKEKDESQGLERDYALAWSYGIKETLSLMIPNTVGGATGRMGENKEAMKEVDRQFKNAVSQQNKYWGSQPFTEGPVYFGAIVVFLFILGLFYVKGPLKWSLLAITILAILLAWGKNLGWFTDIFFYNVPFYNKFRTVSMILVLVGITMPLLGIITLQKIIREPAIIKQKKREFFIAFGLTGGISFLFALMPSAFFDFLSAQEAQAFAQQKAQNPQVAGQYDQFMDNLEAARIAIFKQDAFRTFGFIAVSALLLWVFSVSKKFKPTWLIVGLGFLMVIDLWSVDKRYVNNDDFKTPKNINKQLQARKANQFILKDNDHPNFRVLNITRDPFREVHTSYFHQSIGGYHGAKMRRYQDLIDRYLMDYTRQLQQQFSENNPNEAQKLLKNMPVLNMLNTRYIIYDMSAMPLVNNQALGTAWFPDSISYTDEPGEALSKLGTINPAKTAILNKKYKSELQNLELKPDSIANSSVKRIVYEPDHRVYQVNAKQNELLIVSEIFYDAGWKAKINGEPADILRANYLLKAIQVPKGAHKVEFYFEPKADVAGTKLSLGASLVVLLTILIVVGYSIYKKRQAPEITDDIY